MSSAETTEFDLGCRVRVVGLVQAAHHNGKTGVVVAPSDTQTGRIGVELEDGAEVRIKPCNMQLLQHPDDAAFRADSSRPAQPLQASAAPPEAAAADGESAIVDFLMRQGMSLEQARKSIAAANKKKTDNVTAAIEHAASVKKNPAIKQHLARFGLKNVIKDCGDWSRFPGMANPAPNITTAFNY